MNSLAKNPYVGPRTFQKEEGDLFFGREREARDIIALITSERLVLFYAHSGAGKSSLLNARIIPELESREFEVLPVGRVQGDLPTGLEVENVYIYNLMNGILQQKTSPEALAELSLPEFLRMLDINNSGYFFDPKRSISINTEIHWRRLLVIDQFEEVFTTQLDAWAHRDKFFQQLAQVLKDDPLLIVLLVMRDDYIASLDQYAHLLPGGLRKRYYMQQLTKESALKAVKNPVKGIRPFSEKVAEELVEDLSKIVVHRPGETQEVQGQYVEPVQLQVVCYSLWENLSPDGIEITEADLQEVGDVDHSLENFYNDRIEAVSKEKNISERTIREWFDKELITGSKTRNIVLRGTESSAGLSNDVIETLLGGLIQKELRAGQIWIELSHDRLIEPVRASNAKWFEQNLRLFQRQAKLWSQQNRSKSLLVSGEELAQAEEEAKNLSITPVEEEFLKESHEQQELIQNKLKQEARERHQLQQLQELTQNRLEQETRERRQLQQLQELTQNKLEQETKERNRLRLFLAIAGFLIVVASLFAVIAYSQSNAARNSANAAATAQINAEDQRKQAENANATAQASEEDALTQKQKAEKEANRALAGNLAAEADSQKESNYPLALLLSAKAHELESTILTRTTMFDLLQFTPSTRLFGYGGPVTSLAVSPDGKMIASASCREYINNQCKYGEIVLTNTVTHQLIRKIEGEYGLVNSLAFSRSGNTLLLAAGGCVPLDDKNKGCTDNKGQITLWNITNSTEPKLVSEFDSKHTASVQTIAFSHNGSWLASGSLDTNVILWDVLDPAKPAMLGNFIQGHTSYVYSIAFSSDDKILASAGDDLKIFLWGISNPNTVTQVGSPAQQHTATINSIAFSPDGSKFASASNDFTVVLWTWNASTQRLESPQTLSGHDGYVTSLAFNADGSILASAGFDSQVIAWDTNTGSQMGLPLSGHTKAINTIAFSSPEDGNSQFLFSGGNDRIVIQWDLSSRHPLSQPVPTVTEPDGVGMEATSGRNTARVENEQQIILNGQILQNGHTGTVNSLQFGTLQDGRLLLASASDDQTVILWGVSNIAAPMIFLKLEGFDNPLKMAFFDTGQLVTIEKNSNRAIRWDIDPSHWISLVCEDLVLTEAQSEEWDRLLPDQPYQETCQIIP